MNARVLIKFIRELIKDTGRKVFLILHNLTRKENYQVEHRLNSRQVEMVVKGSLINIMREKLQKGKR